jgi:hypothetical protein
VEEVESFSLFFSFDHFFCKNVILFQDLRNILLTDGILFCICCYNRLHRDLFEAKVSQMKNILGKIKIMMGKGSSYIILVLISGLRKFLEFRHDQIITSCTFTERAHVIMDFFSSVHT